MSETPDYDVVVLGATGYTAKLATAHLARHRPDGLRWALAGRSRQRLEAARDELVRVDPTLAELPIEVVDLTDDEGLAALARRTKVVVNATGPYLLHGEPVVRACAETGTDYVDLTGEPEFVDRMYLLHHETAVRTGARMVHACGFDSAPHDLGALHAAEHRAASGPVTMRGVVSATGGVSGGTLASLMNVFARLRQMRAAEKERAQRESKPVGRRSRAVTGRPRRDRVLGVWLLPLPAIDQQVVARSGAALPVYGPDFAYGHYAAIKRLPVLVGAIVGIGLMVALVQVGPVRRLITSRLPQGTGPDDATRAAASFTVDFVAEGPGGRTHTRVTGPEAYTLSGIALAETALSLALDDNPPTSGQVTTAQVAGACLSERLQRHGLTFTVV